MTDPASTLDCHAAVRRLWEYLDHELTPADHAAVRAHLASCALCYGHFAFERHFLAALTTAQAEERAGPGLHALVMDTLRAEGFTPRYGER